MELNFSEQKYKNIALSRKNVNYENGISSEDAFMIVLNGIDFDTIENLCREVAKKLSISPEDVHTIINNGRGDTSFKKCVLQTAYEIIESNNTLGNKMVGHHNASSWISHSLFEGKVASEFARAMNLNPDTALKLGLLHDIGRKINHSFIHVIYGFEYLIDYAEKNGIDELKEDAFCSLTHSFLSIPINNVSKGSRCANCDPSVPGFYVDENGNGAFHPGSPVEGITEFLANYEYNVYDIILNISDLMAMTKGITSPYDRMMDVYSGKTPDPNNSPYFKVCFINALNRLMYEITKDEIYCQKINYNDMTSVDQIDEILKRVSTLFMAEYQSNIKDNDKRKLGTQY